MEPDDNFTLISSYNIEESHPRQLPKAFTSDKVTPTPLVPDVSLVFDSSNKDMRNHSYNGAINSEPMNSHKSDDNGPRKVKPMPIAPLPNETYAAWRARALNAQSCITTGLLETTFKNSAMKPLDSGISVSVRKMEHTPDMPPLGRDLNHQANASALEKRNDVYSNRQDFSQEMRERAVEGTRMPLQSEHIPEIYRLEASVNPSRQITGMSNTLQGMSRHHSEYPKSTLVNRDHQHNFFISSQGQSLPDHPLLGKEKPGNNKPPVIDKLKHTERSYQTRQVQPPREVVDDFDRPRSWGESLATAKEEGPTKKRDALRDLYRIVQLQNEQLKSLQTQVERLLKKNSSEAEIVKPPGSKLRGSVVRCVEEGTQTSDMLDNVSSVGVMTSIIDSVRTYPRVAGGDSVDDNSATCKCKGCHCKTTTRGTVAIDMDSNEGNEQEPDHVLKHINTRSIPANRKYDAPSCLVRNMRKIHQVIEEETESDEGSNKLNGDMASQTRDNNQPSNKAKSQEVSDAKEFISNQHKQPRNCSNPGRTSARRTGDSEGDRMERRSSSSGKASHDEKDIQERGRQNCKPEEKQKCCPEHNSVKHKALAAKNRQNDDEVTMTLNGVDLQTVTEPQLSPEPSIHVDIQDYQEFSGEMEGTSDEDSYYSEDEDSSSESDGRENPENVQQRPLDADPSGKKAENQEGNNGNAKVGWTFYDNVLGQVNKLLENQEPTHHPATNREGNNQNANLPSRQSGASPNVSPSYNSQLPPPRPQFQYPDYNNQKVPPVPNLEVVREATLQHLRQLGIDLPSDKDNNRFPSSVPLNSVPTPAVRDFHDGRRVTFDPNSNRGRFVGERRPTETSLRIKALALKYLSDDQLASCGYLDLKDNSQPEPTQVPEQPASLAKGVIGEMSSSADFTLYGLNGTNLSFTTLRYLQRYHLLPSNGAGPVGIWRHQDGIQQSHVMEAAKPRGVDLGDTRSPGQIDYTNDYMEGFRQGAHMAMGLNGQGGKAHSSTPANKIDYELPSNKMADLGKEGYIPQKKGDPQGAREMNGKGKQAGHSEKKDATKQRSKGKQRRHHTPRDRDGCEGNGYQNPCLPRQADCERPPRSNVLRESDQNQKMSSNILDITALRQQPKLL